MSIYEYDRKKEEKKLRKAEYEAGKSDGIEIGRRDGIEIGMTNGEKNMLRKLVEKKLRKGKSAEVIAEELEEEVETIEKIIREKM